MMLKLILRDRAVRLLPPWLFLGVLIGLMLSSNQQDAVRHGLTVGVHGFQGFRYVAFLPWGLIALYLLVGGVTIRCHRFDMTLPLPHRTLWLSRVLALTLSALTIVGTAVATLLLRNWLEGFQVVGHTRIESLFAQLAAASSLAVILAFLPRPWLHDIPLNLTYTVYLALVWGGTLAVILLLAGGPPGYALLPAAAALALGLGIYLSLPESFVIVPRKPEAARLPLGIPAAAGEIGAREAVKESRSSSRWLLHATIWRAFYGHWGAWLCFGLLLALGLGVARPDPVSSLNGLWLFILCWLVLSALLGIAVARLHLLDPLPVSRRLIFATIVLPGLLIASLGFLGGRAIRAGRESRLPLVDYREHPVVHDLDVRVPLEFWEIGWDGHPPPVEEPYVPPWEEAHFPWSVSLFKGLPVVLYSPYHAPAGSSPHFVATQLSRAVEAVYGVHIPAGDIQDRYLMTRADGSGGVRAGGFSLLEDYAGLQPTAWTRTAPVMVLLIGLPWLLYVALTVRGGYASASASGRPWGHLGLVGFSALCVLASIWSYSGAYTDEWKLVAFIGILLRKLADSLPDSGLASWGIVALLLGVGYLLAQASFRRIEAPSSAGRNQIGGIR
jgi:hypothetical protein